MDFAERERRMIAENRLLKQMLVDADAVARKRGDEHGLCDSILDKTGEFYPSSTMGNLLQLCKAQGFKPALTLDEALKYERDPSNPHYSDKWSKEDPRDFSNSSLANAE